MPNSSPRSAAAILWLLLLVACATAAAILLLRLPPGEPGALAWLVAGVPTALAALVSGAGRAWQRWRGRSSQDLEPGPEMSTLSFPPAAVGSYRMQGGRHGRR